MYDRLKIRSRVESWNNEGIPPQWTFMRRWNVKNFKPSVSSLHNSRVYRRWLSSRRTNDTKLRNWQGKRPGLSRSRAKWNLVCKPLYQRVEEGRSERKQSGLRGLARKMGDGRLQLKYDRPSFPLSRRVIRDKFLQSLNSKMLPILWIRITGSELLNAPS